MATMLEERIGGIGPADLVRDHEVHRSVYSDPAVFRLEMRRIFGRAWIYLAHDSEVPNAGDYVVRHIGTQAVIVTRDKDGAVKVIFNRCTHRGATLCAFERGQAPGGHMCPYHGWLFAADGTLKSISHKQNYEEVLDPADWAVTRVPRVEAYRGFIFGCLDREAAPLLDFLGHMSTTIDDLVDRSPTGEVLCSPYVLKHYYRGNWKMTFENLNDTIHPGFAHAASVVSAKHVAEEVGGPEHLKPTLGMMMANGKPISFFQQLDMVTAPGGHSYIGGHMGADYTPDTQNAYHAALVARHGPEKAAKVLGLDRHLMLLYPSSTWHARYQTVRIVRPVKPDLTEVIGYTFSFPGAPEETRINAIEYCTGANSAASPVISDDLELYERMIHGNAWGDQEWIPMSRGVREDRETTNEWTRQPSTSEGYIRNQFRAWAAYMGRS
ncbi:aromatic ring-hydroxylating oxygenase subunit alpha [Sphingomonas lenta]|uniref:Ribosomal subunit interface protein n=1 Tax=Sphingomonas lenta TaxID=1141887 RepID=A0A2A2SCP6_9SPHN|nr:Rieske 2Fe-2S domain-containing protein [Sphingomonas lenta]PAX06781.1 ribosomal subunit interface protein [Sphingomonas lenta]